MRSRALKILLLASLLLQGGGAMSVHRQAAHGPHADAHPHAAAAHDCHHHHGGSEPDHAPDDRSSDDDCRVCDMLHALVAAVAPSPTVESLASPPTTVFAVATAIAVTPVRRPDRARAPPRSI